MSDLVRVPLRPQSKRAKQQREQAKQEGRKEGRSKRRAGAQRTSRTVAAGRGKEGRVPGTCSSSPHSSSTHARGYRPEGVSDDGAPAGRRDSVCDTATEIVPNPPRIAR